MNNELKFLGIGIFAISFLMLTTSTDAEAAVDMFLKIEGIEGESVDKDHSGWIEIGSVSYSISSPTTSTSSGGATGKAEFSDVSITKILDKASPNIAVSAANGKHYPGAEIHFCDSASSVCYYKIELRNVMISSYSFSGGGDIPTESVSLAYESIMWDYKPQKADGTDSKDNVVTGWNIRENIEG